MRHLDEIDTFVRVVAHGSFAVAARELGVSPASATRRVMLLEQRLGVKLLSRNTRKLSVTAAGKRYVAFATRILGEIRQEEFDIGRMNHDVDGPLKILVSKSFGNLHMGQAVADFMAVYPKIRTSIVVSDVSLTSLDPIQGGFDLAVRLGEPKASRLFGRSIGVAEWVACASQEYLDRNGEPRTPEDLERHTCITHQIYLPNGIWKFQSGKTLQSVKVSGHASTNSVMVARHLTLNGLGVSLLPTYCIANDLKTGGLKRILKPYTLPAQTIRVLYPHSKMQPKKVRLFIDFLKARFKKAAW